MNMNFSITLVSVLVSAIVLFAFVPMFIEVTNETVTDDNEGYGWARFNYSANTTVSIPITIADNVLSIGGPAPQSGPIDDMIIWADNNLSVYIKNGTAQYIGNNGGVVSTGALSESFTINKTSNNVNISDNGETLTFSGSSWAYIPNANGGYASFKNTSTHLNNDNFIRPFVGGSFGIDTYNSINSVDYDLTFIVDRNGDIINGAEWVGHISE